MERKRSNAFITARKGFCYLTIKYARRNHDMMRIRNYKIDAEEKRHMRRLYPERESPNNWLRSAKHAGATAPGEGVRIAPAIRAVANRFTASMRQAPAPSMSTTLRPVLRASGRCLMPSCKLTAA
jgi:hypothetical protein